MEMFLLWVGFSLVAGVIAEKKGRSGPGFFFLALLFSPLIGIIVAIAVQSRDEKERRIAERSGQSTHLRKCPRCAELVKREAAVCRYCQADLAALDGAQREAERGAPAGPCAHCGTETRVHDVVCPGCGYRLHPVDAMGAPTASKSPG